MSAALTVAEVLERAADLIEPEGKWTQGAFALTAQGRKLEDGFMLGAVCFCALGAIEHVTRLPYYSGKASEAADVLSAYLRRSPEAFNDAPERTQAEVVAKLREAAKLAREQSA